VVLEGNESSSSVNGIPVTTGYFVTSPNSRGEQSAIFFASFSIGNTNVYVECYGDKSDADAVSQETADLIFSIITKGEPDFSAITKTEKLRTSVQSEPLWGVIFILGFPIRYGR